MTGGVRFEAWRSAAGFDRGGFGGDVLGRGGFGGGVHQGTVVAGHMLTFAHAVGLRRYADPFGETATFEYAAWVSPEVRSVVGATALVPSWNAETPGDSWLEVEVRVSLDAVTMSRWFSLGRWAETDAVIHRTSVPGQDDGRVRIVTDTLDMVSGTFASYQLRVALHRPFGSTVLPRVRLLGAMTSATSSVAPSSDAGAGVWSDGAAWGTELRVATYSQQVHRGEYPELGGGGESWCSPTSTSMVLDYWGRGPAPAEYAWVDPGLADRCVAQAARQVYDHAYAGAGNWSFNVAYAARPGLTAFVTRLRSLAEAESYLTAGIPLVASLAFRAGELAGAGYQTQGHLLVIVGFDDQGNVICNDPASHGQPRNEAVRVVYDRAQFERAWQGGSGGIVYVIHPDDVPLPADLAEPHA